uniref:Uncharacterized protein n=1 Tax=Timema shepardi TaxID=629360 RepID=A0A7R9B3W0_TIMSH|nr:unnamed protein product [Timema shepardi]
MEELSRAQFLRLSYAEKDEYLKKLLSEEDDKSDDPSDSEDGDWFPNNNAPNSANAEASDSGDCVQGVEQIEDESEKKAKTEFEEFEKKLRESGKEV